MPCDYSKYPTNWKTEIRPAILERASYCCESCGVSNYAVGCRDEEGAFHPTGGNEWHDKAGNGELSYKHARELATFMNEWHEEKFIVIVLTIAHLHDPDPMNCEQSNLAALCQRCHNIYDSKMRQKNAKDTREKKKGILKLF